MPTSTASSSAIVRLPPLTRIAERAWYGGYRAGIALIPAAALFGAAAAMRRQVWRLGLRRGVALPVPVIVVGNITVGGTGKTPVVGWLGEMLHEAGWQPGIVSRGYGGRHRSGPRLVEIDDDAQEVGDEPLLLRRSTGLPVCIGRDRVAAARLALAGGVNVIISDDGLQHYRLRRDLEIVVLDGTRPFGNGRLLPAGPLREPVSRLLDVDMVLVNDGNADAVPGEYLRFAVRAGDALCLSTGERRPLGSFAGGRVRLLAGIGNPWRIVQQLRNAGIQVDLVPVPDHGRVTAAVLHAEPEVPLFMTAKDAVKYPDPQRQEAWVIESRVEMPERVRTILLQRLGQPPAPC